MAVINTTGTFANNEQVTSDKLNNLIDQSFFIAGAISGSTLEVTSGGQLKVGVITTTELAADSVTGIKILNGEVTPAKLSLGAPTWISGGTTALSSITSSLASVSIGSARTASGACNIDFNSAFPLTSYEARISRESGANGNLVITNSGAGSLVLGTAPIPTPSGTAPVYGARAWVLFDGTRNVTNTGASTIGQPVYMKSNGNVTSVTKDAVGQFTIAFITSMPSSNYAISGWAQWNQTNVAAGLVTGISSQTQSIQSCKICTVNSFNNGFVDLTNSSVIIFG